jgi:hypothetical protein
LLHRLECDHAPWERPSLDPGPLASKRRPLATFLCLRMDLTATRSKDRGHWNHRFGKPSESDGTRTRTTLGGETAGSHRSMCIACGSRSSMGSLEHKPGLVSGSLDREIDSTHWSSGWPFAGAAVVDSRLAPNGWLAPDGRIDLLDCDRRVHPLGHDAPSRVTFPWSFCVRTPFTTRVSTLRGSADRVARSKRASQRVSISDRSRRSNWLGIFGVSFSHHDRFTHPIFLRPREGIERQQIEQGQGPCSTPPTLTCLCTLASSVNRHSFTHQRLILYERSDSRI